VSLRTRVEVFLWEHSESWRRPLRRLRLAVSLAAHRLRRMLPGAAVPLRVVDRTAPGGRPEPVPLVAVAAADWRRSDLERFLAGQTERSVTLDPDIATAFQYAPAGDPGDLPATHLESMVLAAAAGELDLVIAGWAPPAAGRDAPSGAVHRRSTTDPSCHVLVRRPEPTRQATRSVFGSAVAHICSPHDLAGTTPLELPCTRSGPHLVRGDVRAGAVIHHRVASLSESLADVPGVDGPATVLFLLPYLAVGGAERLLYDLLWGLGRRARSLVVTLEPHHESLGQTVDVCRDLTPHVYTLGDWLPRAAQLGALHHLIRRWRVETLVSWNGTVAFFDHAPALKAAFPDLRILSQLYNHRGAWIDRTTPTLNAVVDLHLAVNSRIATALAGERGVPADRIATIYHAVEVPELPGPTEVERRRRARRRQLGIPLESVVIATFARMHPQKRPADVIRLARRMANHNVHFLLVGGGPLDRAVDRELAARPLHNLTRLPFRHDTDELIEAADICLLASEYEGLPVFLLEGMARGLPCVATAVGDIPYLLAEGGGLVSGPPGDLAGLERAVEALLDDRRRAAEGERARTRVVSHFGLDRYVREYEAAIFPATPRS
jgi:glycosyltransferase involved in cell wall biosynthesis